ncbi:hypothetical protein BaRGS_00004241, partial [Batillaria attramentaria]
MNSLKLAGLFLALFAHCQAGAAPPDPGCDFERQNLCTWTNDDRGIFLNWNVESAGSGRLSGGPAQDHTTNSDRGHYILMSRNGGAVIQEAILKSQPLQHTQTYCLHFWYNFPTSSSGQLSVQRQVSGTRTQVLNVLKAEEVQTDLWRRLDLNVAPYSTDYSLVLVADTGASSAGLLAVDDVKLSNGPCLTSSTQPPFVTSRRTPPPLTTSTSSPTSVLPPSACRDKLPNCDEYGNGACVGAYVSWAQEHCPLFCGFCTPDYTTTPAPCVDTLNNCKDYGTSVCSNPSYAKWVRENCRKFCNVCGTTTRPTTTVYTTPQSGCFDAISYCKDYGTGVCFMDTYKTWVEQNCPKFCGVC